LRGRRADFGGGGKGVSPGNAAIVAREGRRKEGLRMVAGAVEFVGKNHKRGSRRGGINWLVVSRKGEGDPLPVRGLYGRGHGKKNSQASVKYQVQGRGAIGATITGWFKTGGQ